MPSMSVPLTRGKVAIVDAEDFERVNAFKWYAMLAYGRWYAVRNVYGPDRDARGFAKGHKVYLHRFILDAADGTEIDHQDGDSLNDRRGNLRFTTHAQNIANQRLTRRNKSSGFIGVQRTNQASTWQVLIRVNGQSIHMGGFRTAEEAARARDAKVRELHGRFVQLNFPD